ncbi:MAG: teicoplanin resistance protein VanZ [Ideonella sp. MAG2]|nr:MAG: teicoplanin resistance protein VanZ [Ideonella sp. MAG2]
MVYASLYPFVGWRWPGGEGWSWLALPMPPWRDRFDMWANLLGYLPLGALVYGAAVRSAWRPMPAALCAVLLPSALSYTLEVIQQFLPGRYPSLLDWWLNTGGAALGMVLAGVAHALAWVDRWQAARERWFIQRSGGALALMALWPVGLLFPTPLPFGLGPGWDGMQAAVLQSLADVSWAEPMRNAVAEVPVPTQRLPLLLEGWGVALGLLLPCLLAYAVMPVGWRRMAMVFGAFAMGFGTATLSAAMNFGPEHALAWIAPVVVYGAAVAAVLALALAWTNQRLAATLGLLALAMLLALVAQAPADPYFAQSLQAWEQGRFIRFHGLARWVGLLWPWACGLWLLGRIAARWR